MTEFTCFKAYDIRGRLGDELNTDIAYRIGRAYAQFLQAKRVVLGGDVRATSEELKLALAQGIMDAGCDVLDLGMTGTEQVYFAAFHLDVDGGIEVTASHNPIDFNGMKLVRRNAQPISGDTGLKDIQQLAESGNFSEPPKKGSISSLNLMSAYVEHLLGYVDLSAFKPLRLVVNAGNGSAGPVLDAIEAELNRRSVPVSFIKVHHEPDPTFPHGIPNPLLPENRSATAAAVFAHGADMGIAWDGDFDRCFLFDEHGDFIEGYYIVGLLAEAFLLKNPGEKVIHDPRLTWNTVAMAERSGGVAIQSKTGHAFIKEHMRKENAIYGGEMSAHHYFRDFAYCDSGMIPWLLVAELLCVRCVRMSELVGERMKAFPCSGEINYTVNDVPAVLVAVQQHFSVHNPALDFTDGLSMELPEWRMNIRGSNTEPLLRVNIETRSDLALLKQLISDVDQIIGLVT